MLGHQRIDDLAEGLAFHDLRQLVEREVDAVIADATLREIVGADAFGPVARADLAAARGGARRIKLLALMVVQPGAQHGHRLGAIAVLRAVLLHHHHDASRQVGQADRGFGLVDVLAAGAAGAQGVDPEVAVVDRDVDLLGFGQHRDGRRGGVDAARRLGVGHTLHPVHAGLVFHLGESAASLDLGDDFLVAAHRAFAGRHHLDLPAVLRRISLVHAEQVAGEQSGLVTAGAAADLQDDVALIHRVLRDQREADLVRERFAARFQGGFLGFRQRAHLGIGRGVGQHGVEIGDLGADPLIRPDDFHQRLELGELARQLHIGVAVRPGREVALHGLEPCHQRIELGLRERDGHGMFMVGPECRQPISGIGAMWHRPTQKLWSAPACAGRS
jgi:hypothetical protein